MAKIILDYILKKVLTSIPPYGIMAFIMTMPWLSVFLPGHYAPHDWARLIQIVLMLFCLIGCIANGELNQLSFKLHSIAWIGIFIFFCCLSIINSENQAWALKEAGTWIGMFAIICTIGLSKDQHLEGKLFTAIITSALLFNTLNISLAISGMYCSELPIQADNLSIGYENRRFFNHTQTVSIPLATAAYFWSDKKKIKAISTLSTVSGFALAIATDGRATLLSILASSLLLLIFSPHGEKVVPKKILKDAGAGLIIYGLLFNVLPFLAGLPAETRPLDHLSESHTASLRLQLITIAAKEIWLAPLTGIGPMHFSHHLNDFAAHPHNIYFQIGAEWGIPILCLVIIFMTSFFTKTWAMINSSSGKKKCTGIAIFIAMAAAMIDGLFSGNFVMPMSQTWIAITFGCAAYWRSSPDSKTHENSRSRIFQKLLIAVFFAIMLLATIETIIDFQYLDTIIKISDSMGKSPKIMPRYWSSGWF